MFTKMSPSDLREALDVLDVGQVDLGRVVGYNARSAQRWVQDDGRVPGPIALIVSLLMVRPELVQVIGLKRHSRAGRKPRVVGKAPR